MFVASEKELVETVDSLERAIMVLKKNLGFMQTGRSAHVLEAMASGLKKVIEASWVNAHQKSVLQSLLQTKSEDSDEDLEFQPQGKTVAYESSSGGILDTIADMQSKAEESLSSTRKLGQDGSPSRRHRIRQRSGRIFQRNCPPIGTQT